jgi:hypothetical protein
MNLERPIILTFFIEPNIVEVIPIRRWIAPFQIFCLALMIFAIREFKIPQTAGFSMQTTALT